MSQIPAGYKQTEVGVIPEEWEVKTYGEIFEFLTTASYSRAELSDNNNVQYVHYGDIHTKYNFFIDFSKSKLPTINGEQLKNYPLLKDGDVIMADASEDYQGIGKSVEIKNLRELKAISGLHTFLLRDKDKTLADGFRGYLHVNTLIKVQFDRLATGLKVYGLSKNNLKLVQIPLPPKPEQEAIAEVLSDADALIEATRRLIEKKRLIKQGAMQHLLTPKDDWEVKKLGELGKCHRGVSYSPEKDLHPFDKNFTVRLLRSNNIQNRNLDFTDLQFVNSEIVKENQILQENDIVICMANGSKQLVGKSAIFKTKDSLKYTFGAFMSCFRVDQTLASSLYIAANFQSYQYRNYIDVLLSGSSINNLNPSNIESISIPFPNISEQTRIATILSDMDEEIEALESKLSKQIQIKEAMMQNLLTGKVRLV